MTADYDVVLVRHGQTTGYSDDLGLTELGVSQARGKGAALAATILPGSTVRLPHALSARATETAAALRDGMVSALGGDSVGGTVIEKPYPDHLFGNSLFCLDGQTLEPTAAANRRLRLDGARPLPGWAVDYDRFDQSYGDAAGGPIDYWISHTTMYFEPPQVAVHRLWHGIAGIDPAPRLLVVACTHSAVLRAFAAAAVGTDPGEPDHVEHVWVRVRGDEGRATVSYREYQVDTEIPRVLPPWINPEWVTS